MRGAAGIALLLALVIGVPVVLVVADGDGGDDDAPPSGQGAAAGSVPPAAPAELPPPSRGSRTGPTEPPATTTTARPKAPAPPRDSPSTENVAYPNDVTRAGTEIARAVEEVFGDQAKQGQPTVLGADCRSDGSCTARYVSRPHGRGRQLVDGAALLQRIFARPAVRSVTLYVHEPRGNKKKAEVVVPQALAVIACDRSSAPQWKRVTVRQVARRCDVSNSSPGRAGAQIAQGRLSEEDASLGREAGPRPGSGKPKGAPRDVAGSKAAERAARKRRGR